MNQSGARETSRIIVHKEYIQLLHSS